MVKSHPVSSALLSLLLLGGLLAGSAAWAAGSEALRVGVTLHPYYSWTRNVVEGTNVVVIPVLPGDIDAGNYQPRPEDIKKLMSLDAIVINGIGHDDFIFPMIKASGNSEIQIIRPNANVPLLNSTHGDKVNSHTFISFSNAIQGSYAIATALGSLQPNRAGSFREHAAAYARRLRKIKNRAAAQLANRHIDRVVTVHDGYGYLMQELGIEIAGVVEPAHGLLPSVEELAQMIDLIRREKIRVVFSEVSFPAPLVDAVRAESDVHVYVISHIASGEFTPEKFENEMQGNVDTIVEALVTDGR